jgi:diacylglycerol kinase family enzyme
MSVTILINRRARRGSEKIAKLARRLVPGARVVVTHSFDDVERWLTQDFAPNPTDVVLAGGGDGTTIGLLNAMRKAGIPFPIIGVLPLGTGNAWARTTHAPPAPLALARLGKLEREPPPTRHFALVEMEGHLAHFAGTGWDAELISDYHAWLDVHAHHSEASGNVRAGGDGADQPER